MLANGCDKQQCIIYKENLKCLPEFSVKLSHNIHITFYYAGIQHGTIYGTQPYGLPLGETTTPQYLNSLGYSTHGVGKVFR